MGLTVKIIISGALFLSAIASGIWLNRSGKPLNTAIFTAHKLIALAAVVFTGILIYNLYKSFETNVFIFSLIILAVLLALVIFASGGLLSAEKPLIPYLLIIHNSAMAGMLVTAGVAVYFLAGNK